MIRRLYLAALLVALATSLACPAVREWLARWLVAVVYLFAPRGPEWL